MARYNDAEESYRTILAAHPDNTDAMFGLAVTLKEMAQYNESEKILQKLLTIEEAADPNSIKTATVLNNLASVYQATNRLDEAVPLMLRALEIFIHFTRQTRHHQPLLQTVKNSYIALLIEMGTSPDQALAQTKALAPDLFDKKP